MREIKFRAWLVKTKQMVYGVEQDNDLADIITDNKYENGNYILMQFTGLYDKNKTPIYEGDILKFINNRSEDEDVSTSKVYTFEGVPFCIDIETGEYDVQTLAWAIKGDISECEVIGNIYDNPDLLGE